VAGIGNTITVLAMLFSVAQDDVPQRPGIPIIGRPTAGFYGAAGTGVTVTATVDPTEVPLDEWLTLTLTVRKVIDPRDIEKPTLRTLEEFKTFQINESASLDPQTEKPGERVFIYKLRPVSIDVTQVPLIDFYYYDPRRVVAPNRPQDKFPRTASNAVTIRVLPAKVSNEIAPEFSNKFQCRWLTPSVPSWYLLLGPIIAISWVVCWRCWFPSEYRLRALLRNRVARQAVAGFRNGDEPEAVLSRYLSERFSINASLHDQAPFRQAMFDAGIGPDAVEAVMNFLQPVRFRRYSGLNDDPPYREEGIRLIERLEGAG